MLITLIEISKEYDLNIDYLISMSKFYGIIKRNKKGNYCIEEKYIKLLKEYYSMSYLRNFIIYWIEYTFDDRELRVELLCQLIRMNYKEIIRFIILKDLMWEL